MKWFSETSQFKSFQRFSQTPLTGIKTSSRVEILIDHIFKMQFKVFVLAALAPIAAFAYSGKATYYDPNGGYGACGTKIQNSDYAIALSVKEYGSGSNCGRKIKITHNGHSVSGWVKDKCEGCAEYQLDLAQGLFTQFAETSVGVIDITWGYDS